MVVGIVLLIAELAMIDYEPPPWNMLDTSTLFDTARVFWVWRGENLKRLFALFD